MSAIAPPFDLDVDFILALPEPERTQALKDLARYKQLVERNPLWRYFPHEGERGWKIEQGIPLIGGEFRGQQQFHEIEAPNGAFVAGNRGGKTEAGAVAVLIEILPPEFLPPWLLKYRQGPHDDHDEFFARAIGVDLGKWWAKALQPKLRRMIPPAALFRGEFDKAYKEREQKLQFADGSWWDFLTHDMDIDAFASADLDWAWFDEEPKGEKGKQQFEETLGRLVDRDGIVRWTLTPLLGLNFVYYELTDDQGNPRNDDECEVVIGDIDHNPHLSERGRRRFLKRFKGDPLKLQARKSGRWVHFAGRVYDEFAEDEPPRGHVVPPRPIPREHEGAKPKVPIFTAIDPGIAADHPAAILFAWLNSDDVLEVFHTHRIWQGTVADMADHYHDVCATNEIKPRWRVIDPSARNKQHQTGRSTQQEYSKHRVYTTPGQNDRQAGINAVKERLRSGRLVIHADCTDLIEELRDYRWKGNKRSSSEDAAKPDVIKKKDDLADCLRYLVMQLPRAPEKPKPEEQDHRSNAERALHDSIKALRRRGRRRRGRIGGYV